MARPYKVEGGEISPWWFESTRAHFQERKVVGLKPGSRRTALSSAARTVRRAAGKGAGPRAFARVLRAGCESKPPGVTRRSRDSSFAIE